VFPVAGPAAFGDSYGGVRSDVRSGWHHGDDIFAPLGTPVVAVADGTLNRVGWERLGGWRLWVRDRAGDEFYYAHLSGYTPLALRGGRVHRGEVIGFVGNTGDAFTTLPHLHFEVHPRQLLTLRYDGAVDPTSYLMGWRRPGTLRAAHPVLPPLPHGVFLRSEALTNFRELLAARGLDRPAAPSAAALAAAFGAPPMVVGLPRIAAVAPTAAVRRSTSSGPWVTAGAEAALVALGVALAAVLWRRRRPAELRRPPLRKARQPVVGDRLPARRVRDELAVGRADARVLVEAAETDPAHRRIVGVLRPEVRAALRTEDLRGALRRSPPPHELLALHDPQRPGDDARRRGGGGAGPPLAAGAMAVARRYRRLRQLPADASAQTATRQHRVGVYDSRS
jgi:hypothetical protein